MFFITTKEIIMTGKKRVNVQANRVAGVAASLKNAASIKASLSPSNPMRFVLLTSKPDSQYADTPTSYEYPARYRRFFEPLENGEPMIAIIYEPRSGGRGRMSYVGWAALRGVPSRSPRMTDKGQPLYQVQYFDRVQEFPNPVPREYLGQPVAGTTAGLDPQGFLLLNCDNGRTVRILAGGVRPL